MYWRRPGPCSGGYMQQATARRGLVPPMKPMAKGEKPKPTPDKKYPRGLINKAAC